MQVEFLKVLACIAWADEKLTTGEINFIKKFMRQFDLSGEEWTQVEMYLDERVGPEETKRVTRRFLSRVARPKERRMLVEAVRHLLESDGKLTEAKREWLRGLDELVSETRGKLYLMDGLKSLLRLGGKGKEPFHDGREADLHDFIHNRVLFRLRRRLGARRLEEEGSPEKLKKLT
ncbi:MAG: TerB family tellurite resistance protein, partial [Candidatus Binatia bacterium]